MNKQGVVIIVAASAWICAHAQEAKVWQESAVPRGGPAETRNIPIVDFGANYARYHFGQFLLTDFINVKTGLDLDGDGENDDSISFVPYQLDEFAPKPRARSSWHSEAVSGKIYIARTMHALDYNEAVITESGGPNPNHSLMVDDINMMSWAKKNPDSKIRGYGLWMWKKEDFLGGGDQGRVGFDENSSFAVHLPRYWQNVEGSKFVVLDADASGQEQWYISEQTGSGGDGINHTLSPTETRWAKYNPQETPNDIRFPIEDAVWEKHEFKDVRAVGYYMYRDTYDTSMLAIKLGAFEVVAAVERPKNDASSLLSMRAIPGSEGVPSFLMSRCEIPYALYADVHDRHGHNMYALEKGVEFYKEPKIGSAWRLDERVYEQDEPVTGITFLDAVAWCNALSICDGFEPVYYADPEFKEVFKRAVERQLDPAGYIPEVYVKWTADGYRLPTPAEWGSAAGNIQSQISAFKPSATTRPVGSGTANEYGLYDILGSVWEYAWDVGDAYNPAAPGFETERTVLGGDVFYPEAPALHPASPYGDKPWDGAWNIGFRVVRRAAGLGAPKSPKSLEGSIPSWRFAKDEIIGGDEKRKPDAEQIEMAHIPYGEFQYEIRYQKYADVTLSDYKMAQTETTYAQWMTVLMWAQAKGYLFDYEGDMGSSRYHIGKTSHTPDEPVSNVSWRDVAVWCNALSEMEGRRPVYYADKEKTQVYRGEGTLMRPPMVQLNIVKNKEAYSDADQARFKIYGEKYEMYEKGFRDVFIDYSGNGYRLPTSMEWLRAAGTIKKGEQNQYAWTLDNSDGRTHPVGQLSPNEFGLFDMQGNVAEIAGWAGRFNPMKDVNPKLKPEGGAPNPKTYGCSAHMTKECAYASSIGYYDGATVDQGFRVVRCDDRPQIKMGGKMATLVGPQSAELEALQGKRIKVEGKKQGRFFYVKSYEVLSGVSGEGLVTIGPAHLKDGSEEALERDLMDVEMGQKAEQLEGATYRANNDHTGYFKASGVPALNGVKWKFKTGDRVRCQPVVVDGVVYVGSLDKNFYAIDAETGAEKWRFGTGGQIYASPTVYDGVVYFGSNDGHLYAITTSGEFLWKVKGDNAYENREWEEQASTQEGAQPDVSGAPVVAYGLVFAKVQREMRGYDLKTGEKKWVNIAGEGRGTQQTGTLTIWDGSMYYGYFHAGFGGYSLKTLGRFPGGFGGLGNSTERSTPAIYKDKLYHLGIFGNIHCDDPRTGEALYMKLAGASIGRTEAGQKTGCGRFATYTSPSVGEDIIVFSTHSGYISGLDVSTGNEIWLTDVGEDVIIHAPAALANGHVYQGCKDGRLFCLDLKTGKIRWEFLTGGAIFESPYIGDGVLYIGSDDGMVYALKGGSAR